MHKLKQWKVAWPCQIFCPIFYWIYFKKEKVELKSEKDTWILNGKGTCRMIFVWIGAMEMAVWVSVFFSVFTVASLVVISNDHREAMCY